MGGILKRTVVIIDDSVFMAELLGSFFEETLNFRVLATGSNGMQAVSLYREYTPDLLTMDMTMPVKDGRTALVEILADFPKAKILLITSQLGPSIVECLKLGAAGYVEKPLHFESLQFIEEFKETVNRALSGV